MLTETKSNIHDENAFYYGIADYLFKNILFGKDEKLTKWFLSKILNMSISSIEFKNIEMPRMYHKTKRQSMDVILVVNDTILLDLEANAFYYKSLHKRNFGYAMKLYNQYLVDNRCEDISELILIDFTRGLGKRYQNIKNTTHLQTVYREKYVQNFKTLLFDIDKALKCWYSNNEFMIYKYFYLIMLVLNGEELEKLEQIKGLGTVDRYYLQKYRNEVVRMNSNPEMRMWEEREQVYLNDIQDQIEDAKEEVTLTHAKEMLINKITPELVAKCTHLPLTTILKIQESLS